MTELWTCMLKICRCLKRRPHRFYRVGTEWMGIAEFFVCHAMMVEDYQSPKEKDLNWLVTGGNFAMDEIREGLILPEAKLSDELDRSCGKCSYWKSSEGLEYGECRANPPVFSPELASILGSKCQDCHQRGFWPETHQDEFCGHFEQDSF